MVLFWFAIFKLCLMGVGFMIATWVVCTCIDYAMASGKINQNSIAYKVLDYILY